MIESLAIVNAGASSELFSSNLSESLLAIESALAIESITALIESEISGTCTLSTFSAVSPSLLARLLLRSSCDDTVNEQNTSSITAASPHLLSHIFSFPLPYDDIK